MAGRVFAVAVAGTAGRITVAAALFGAVALNSTSCAEGGRGLPGGGTWLPDVTAPPDGALGNAFDATSGNAEEAGEASPGDGVDATLNEDADVDADVDQRAPETDGAPGTDQGGTNFDLPHDAANSRDADLEAAAIDAGSDADAIHEGGAHDPSDAQVDGPTCACGTRFSCGAGHYCVTPTGVPAFGHVFVVVLDNQPLSAIRGNASAPYLNKLMTTYAYGTDYTTAIHPSLPNLVALTSGNPQQLGCDCSPGTANTCVAGLNCNGLGASCTCPVAVTHLGDELDGANVPWRAYAESMGEACNPGGVDGGTLFAASHVPFLYYADVLGNSARCVQRVRDFADFGADLATGAYRFSFITPNLCNDMHGGCATDPIKQGDQWLAAQVPALLATAGFAASGTDVLFIVGDEPDGLSSAPVPFVVVSPLARQVATAGAYTHDSLLATIEDGLGVARLGSTMGSATIADVWR